MRDKSKRRAAEPAVKVPADPWQAFAYFVSKCAEGFGAELMEQGHTKTGARNAIVGCFLNFAAGEACRIARGEGREPDIKKWRKATRAAFDSAVKRTTPQPLAAKGEK